MDNYLLPTTKRPIIVFWGFFVGLFFRFWWAWGFGVGFFVDFFKQKLFSRKLIVSEFCQI